MANSENPEVNVVSDNLARHQWARRLLYRQEGQKEVVDKKKFVIGALAIFAITTAVLLTKDIKKYNEPKKIEQPEEFYVRSASVEIQEFDYTKHPPSDGQKHTLRAHKIEGLKIHASSIANAVPPGTQAIAILETGGSNGPVKARLLEDVEINGQVIFDADSKLIGAGSSTEDRLVITFDKLVDQNGAAKDIQANAFDSSDSILGLKGNKVGRVSKKLLAGVGLGVAGALGTLQTSSVKSGVEVTEPTLGNALLSGASTSALELAQEELEDLKEKQAVIEVPKGTKIIVVFGIQ